MVRQSLAVETDQSLEKLRKPERKRTGTDQELYLSEWLAGSVPTGGGKGGEGAKDWNRVVATPHPKHGDVGRDPQN